MIADLIMIISFILMVGTSVAAVYLWAGITACLFVFSAWCYVITQSAKRVSDTKGGGK